MMRFGMTMVLLAVSLRCRANDDREVVGTGVSKKGSSLYDDSLNSLMFHV